MSAKSELARDREWQRLDSRMLLVHPIREVLRFLPVLIGLALAGTASDGPQPWHYLGVAFPVALGVLRYLTTRFRIADGRVELRRGLLEKKVTSTQLDRVRTVDLTASPIHRLLGLTRVRIGTGLAGGDDDELELDGLPQGRAEALRSDLLRLVHHESGSEVPTSATPRADEEQFAAFDPAWVRFAPFSGTTLLVAAATFGALAQVLNSVGFWDEVRPGEWSLPVPSGLAIASIAIALLVMVAAISAVGYLVTNGGYRLSRVEGAWHVRRGLLTTRETTLDEGRLAGVSLGEPLALRVTGGRSLTAIVTGVSTKDAGSAMLVPPADAAVAPRVAATVLGTARPAQRGPAHARARGHPPSMDACLHAPRHRSGNRSGALPRPTRSGGHSLSPHLWRSLATAVVARDRSAGLGSALIERHVVARSGSLTRSREILATEHVIGWTWRSTWFQRRVGLTTLAATTAAGAGAVTLLDVPETDGVGLAAAAVPGLVEQFVEP